MQLARGSPSRVHIKRQDCPSALPTKFETIKEAKAACFPRLRHVADMVRLRPAFFNSVCLNTCACVWDGAAKNFRVGHAPYNMRLRTGFFVVGFVGLVGWILPLIPVSGLIRGGQPPLANLVDQGFELAYGGHNTRPTSSSCALPALSSCDDPATASMRRRAQNSKPTSETASRTCSGRLASQHQ